MKKQVYAVLCLVCGLLGFNLIAIAQTFSYMQLSRYLLTDPNIDPSIFAIGSFYKGSALFLGILALVMNFLYHRSDDTQARFFNTIGGILGVLSILLALLPLYLWLA